MVPSAGLAVITESQPKQFVNSALHQFTTKSWQQYATLFLIHCFPVSCLFVLPFGFESTRTETVVQWICWRSHTQTQRNSADARRPGWIDLTMKTTTNSRQASPHLSYAHIHTYTTLQIKLTCIPLTKKIHKTKRTDLDGNFFGCSAVP